MGLLNQQGKKNDKKNNKSQPKNNNSGSKFISKGKSSGFTKKPMTGGAQRGS